MMDRLPMTLGFTENKLDSNLFFKVEGGRLVMILLCVDALFSRHGGVVECRWNLPGIMDDGLQGHDHTYGIKHEAVE